jgi:hypothetical protein
MTIMELSGKLITLATVGVVVFVAFRSFRWGLLARATWQIFWGFLAAVFLTSLLKRRDPIDFWLLLSFATMGAIVWGVVLLPVLLLGAWAMRRVRQTKGQ